MINTTTSLLPHQARAVEKLKLSRVGALFMEMGTGKSRTAIEIVATRQHKISRVIWLCPVALKQTVKFEILKHTDASESDINVFDDKTGNSKLPSSFWHVVGVESVSASTRVALALHALIDSKTMVIMDESSYIKGPFSTRTMRVTEYAKKARYRLILTGTPISQGVVDLFAQMKFLSPEILGYNSFYTFARRHLIYSDRFPGMIISSKNIPFLSAQIEPYVYQVTKDECMDLPDKMYDHFSFDMTREQKRIYEEAKEYWFEQLVDYNSDYQRSIVIMGMFTALQQVACGFWHRRVKGGWETVEMYHHRLEYLQDAIDRASGQIVIWSKYQHDIAEIKEMLQKQYGNDSVCLFHGDINEKQRAAELDKFHSGSARFFLATPQCGGYGLTLNEAETVIFYSNGFKYSERIQAEDRTHRIGQTKRVLYIDIWADCGIEDRISSALASKGNAVDSFREEIKAIKDLKGKDRKEALKKIKERL